MNDRKEKIEKMDKLFNVLNDNANSKMNIGNPTSLAPDIESTMIIDYEQMQTELQEECTELLNDLAKLYLNDNKVLLENNYIKKKIKNDADNLADMFFLKKVTNRNLISQIRTIDAGDITPRTHEVFIAASKEIREIIKQASSVQNQLESFYKNLRADLGIEDTPIGEEINEEKNKTVISQKDFNKMLEDLMKNVESKKT